jgi:hypothetical protein
MKHLRRVLAGRLLAAGLVLAVFAVASIVPWGVMAQAPQKQSASEDDAHQDLRARLQKPLTLKEGMSNSTLQDSLEILSCFFDVRIRIDNAAFQNQLKAEAVGDQGVWLPKQSEVPMGVILGALVGQVGGTFELNKDGILVVPAPKGTTLVERLTLTGPGKSKLMERPLSTRSKQAVQLHKKLSKPVTLEKGIEANTTLQDTVEYLGDLFDLNIILDDWAFKSIGVDRISDQPISMAGLENVPLRTLLDHLCKQINSTCVVADNMIVIVPTRGVGR